jgi:hypothetical protein
MSQTTQNHQQNIFEIIEDRLIPDRKAKQIRGEVFTPINLVNEMLFGLRKSVIKKFEGELPKIHTKEYYQLIWGLDAEGNIFDDDEDDRIGGIPLSLFRDSETKWLDPANGIGNFPVAAFYMLDYQLNKHGKETRLKGDSNAAKRRKHIIEKMLFMIELNKENTNIAKKIFKLIDPDSNPKIFCANTLNLTDDTLLSLMGVNRFDIIMGNPPYNSGGVKASGVVDADYESIWTHFLYKTTKPFPGCLNLLNPDGYLCFIHPSSWLNHKSKMAAWNKKVLPYHLPFIRMYTDAQTNELFSGGGAIRTAYYILQNRPQTPEQPILLLDTNNTIDKIDRRIFEHQNEFTIYSSNNGLIYKTFHKLKPIGSIDGYLKTDGKLKKDIPPGKYPYIASHTEKGIYVCKANQPFLFMNTPKIIIKGTRHLYFIEDYSGKYGVFGNEGSYFIDTIQHLKRFSKFLNTNLVKIILESTKKNQANIDSNCIPDIREYSGEISDKALCEFLGIDYEYVKNYKKFPLNNQQLFKETKGCKSSQTKTKEKSKPIQSKNTTKKRRSK